MDKLSTTIRIYGCTAHDGQCCDVSKCKLFRVMKPQFELYGEIKETRKLDDIEERGATGIEHIPGSFIHTCGTVNGGVYAEMSVTKYEDGRHCRYRHLIDTVIEAGTPEETEMAIAKNTESIRIHGNMTSAAGKAALELIGDHGKLDIAE